MIEIASALQPFVDRRLLAGAVLLVATKDRIVNLEAVGYADLAAKRVMQSNDLFWIASVSKPMTATALMMLADEGGVNVDDPVEKYLPEFNGQMVMVEKDEDHVLLKRPVHPLCVRHILSHTGGVAFASPVEKPTLDQLRLRDWVRSHAMSPLLFEPGSQYLYSNGGTNTAGRIIEVVSGMTYEDFMQERLFGPLGMRDTTFWPNEEQLGRLAKAYKMNQDKTGLEETHIQQLTYPLNDRRRQPMPAGGIFSTATDVALFCQMILHGGEHAGKRLLSAAAIEQMTSRQTGSSIPDDYGFGWRSDGITFGHGGALKNDMNLDPKQNRITLFMVQYDGEWPDDLKNTIKTFMKEGRSSLGS
jgi:CubicO group peptidase (beta-lactamase class C family)